MAKRRNLYNIRPPARQAVPRRRTPAPRRGSNPTVGPSTPRPQLPGPPLDPLYTDQLGLNQRNLDLELAGIGYARTQLGQEYGYNQQGQADESNPFSRRMLLARSYQQGQSGTTNSMAAGGQLYSGALQRNLDEGTRRYAVSEDSLKRAAAAGYQSLAEREARARAGLEQGNIDARDDSLARVDPEAFVPLPTRTVGAGGGQQAGRTDLGTDYGTPGNRRPRRRRQRTLTGYRR